MATTNELLINITYDDAKAIANFKKVADKITTQASKLEDKKTEIATIGQAKREVEEQRHLDRKRRQNEIYQQRLEQKLEQSNAKILSNQNSWSKRMTDSLGNITAAVYTFAAAWVSSQVSAAFAGAVKHADDIGDLASAYNLTTKSVQKLANQFKSAGTDINGMSAFLARMSLKLSQANTVTKEGEKAQRDLAKFGISANDDIATAIDKVVVAIKNQTANASDLQDIFGKLGITALPMLKDMATQAELLGRYGNIKIIAEGNLETLGTFQRDLDMLAITLKSAFAEALAGILGTDAKNAIPQLIKNINNIDFEKVGKGTKVVSEFSWALSTLSLKIAVFNGANINAILKSFDALLIDGEKGVLPFLNEAKVAVGKNAQELDRLTESLVKQTTALENLENAVYSTYKTLKTLKTDGGLSVESLTADTAKLTATFEELAKGTLGLKESLKFLWSANFSNITKTVSAMRKALEGTGAVGDFIQDTTILSRALESISTFLGPVTTFFTRIFGTIGLVVNATLRWGAQLRFIGILFKGLQTAVTFMGKYFLPISAVLSAIDFFSVYKRATTVIGVWKNFIYSVMYTFIQAANGFTFGLLGTFDATKNAIKSLQNWIDQNAPKIPAPSKNDDKNSDKNKGKSDTGVFGDLYLSPELRKAIETNNQKELDKFYKKYKEYKEAQERQILLGKLSSEDSSYAYNTSMVEALSKIVTTGGAMEPPEEYQYQGPSFDTWLEGLATANALAEQWATANALAEQMADTTRVNLKDLLKDVRFENIIVPIKDDIASLAAAYQQSIKYFVDSTNSAKNSVDELIQSTLYEGAVYLDNIQYLDKMIEKYKDNADVLAVLTKKREEAVKAQENKDNFYNWGTSYEDIFGDTWEKQKANIEQLVERGRELTSAINELSVAGINAAIEEWTKKIALENSYWSLKSENMKNAGLEQTAYYRMIEKEHNKNLKNLQEAENKAKAEGWEKEQEYKKASMTADLAMGIFKIWAESGIDVWLGAAMTALLTGTFGVQMATLNNLKNPFRKYFGGWVGGQGASDNQAHLLAPGEFVVNSQAAKNNARALNDMNNGRNVSEPAINIHINGNVIGNRDYVRNHLAPEIKKAIKEGYSFA